jgi:type IV pilus assembly protein PilQ
MSKQWRWSLAAAVGSMLVATALLAGPGGSLLDLEVEKDAAGAPTVRLLADGPVEVESFMVDQPDRLVVDLKGVISRLDSPRLAVDAGGVLRVRAAQHQLEPVPVTRVVFDLDHPVEYRIDETEGAISVAFGPDDATLEPPAAPTFDAPAAPPAQPEMPAAAPRIAVEPAPVAQPELTPVSAAVATEQPTAEQPQPESAAPSDAQPTPNDFAASVLPRSVDPAAIDELLHAPSYAAPQESQGATSAPSSFESQRILTDQVVYRGKRISLNLVDADIKQVFRLFHEISGLNFVLDPDVTGRVTIVLDQVPWDQALDIILKNNGLDKVLENNVLRIATTDKLAQEAASRKRLKEAEELEVEPVTLTRTLSYARAADVEQVIREGGVLSDRGKVMVDERTNTLIISDIPKRVEPLDSLISTLDSETPQVMIEARIVETSKNFSRDLGIIWGFEAHADAAHGTALPLNAVHNASARYALNLPGDGGASQLGFSFGNILDSFTLDLALNALETEGRGRIISAPKIATQNNERAEIEQGVRIPITNTTATEIQVEFVSASLLLAVTPQITAEGTIILDVTVENNSPDFVNTAGGIPSIRTQRAQTKVLINDGGTTVIGGIFVVNEGDSEVGVPWFRKIPVFGWLFKQQSIQQENRELLIFITPKIVKLS